MVFIVDSLTRIDKFKLELSKLIIVIYQEMAVTHKWCPIKISLLDKDSDFYELFVFFGMKYQKRGKNLTTTQV